MAFIVRIFVNDTIAIAVWTSFHATAVWRSSHVCLCTVWLRDRTFPRELRKARRPKDAMRLARELKKAQIEYGYAQHWAMLT
jgi:hypothetical protein